MSNLLQIIERFKNTPILLVGDLMLDHYVWGKVDRISPEAPVVVVQVTEESERPGGAALVAHNLVQLGAKVFLSGVVGEDVAGQSLCGILTELRVDTTGLVVDHSRPTTIKTRVIAHAQQVVRVDREESSKISNQVGQQLVEQLDRLIPQTKALVISDYAKGVIDHSLFELLDRYAQRKFLGYGKYPVIIDPKERNFALYRHATAIKPNRAEAARAAEMEIRDREQALIAAQKLLKRWQAEMMLITLGEDGMILVADHCALPSVVEIDTVAREVFDVSGAGDTVNAVFSLALAVGATPMEAAQLANYAAGLVVAEVGTVAVSAHDLRAAVLLAEES